MGGIYKELTKYLARIKEIEYETSQIPLDMLYEQIGQELARDVYRFDEEHPEYGLRNNGQILEKYNIKWDYQSMLRADVSKMDGQGIVALLLAAIRAERFCDCVLVDLWRKGCIQKWLERLVEVEEG